MIHTNRIVTVGEQESIIDRPIVLYRGDREVEIEFTLVGNEFTFSEEGNVIKSVNASHGQLVLNTPSGEHMFSELAECHEGKVVFVVTKEMIDEFIEVGFYSFQIRLYDSAEMKSRVTIPPVLSGFDIRNPIAAEDEANVVDQGLVDYARIFKDQSNEELPTFDWTGAYNKTEWVHHDVITENKLNKIEDALYSINADAKKFDVEMRNTLNQVTKDADKYIKEHMAEVEADVDEFERNLNTDVQQFKIDTNATMTAHKNKVSEVVDGFSGEIESINSQLAHNTNLLEYRNGYVSVKEYGAKGDGVNDDTEAINNAISQNSCVIFPPGKYLISGPIFIGYKKEVRGYGDSTIITTNISTDIFHVGYRCILDGFRVETWPCTTYDNNIITVNDITLREWTTSEGNAALKTRIQNISVRSGNSGTNSSVITLSMTNMINNKFDGFFDVILDNISNVGYDAPIQYFMRNFCKNNFWITGITLSNCVNQHTVWGIFDGENDIDFNDPSITSCIGKLRVYNYQHQCDYTTKAYAYIRDGHKSFVQCIPWDWQYATDVYNGRPWLIHESISSWDRPDIPVQTTNEVNTVDSLNTMTSLDWHDITRLEKVVNLGGGYNQIKPKIFALGNMSAANANNTRKAVLLYRNRKALFVETFQALIFSYRHMDSIGWIDVSIRPNGDGTYSYVSNGEIPSRIEFRVVLDDTNAEVYACAADKAYVYGLDQMDLIKTEPLSNNMTSYTGNSTFTNYFFTPNNLIDEYKSTPLENSILVTKKA